MSQLNVRIEERQKDALRATCYFLGKKQTEFIQEALEEKLCRVVEDSENTDLGLILGKFGYVRKLEPDQS